MLCKGMTGNASDDPGRHGFGRRTALLSALGAAAVVCLSGCQSFTRRGQSPDPAQLADGEPESDSGTRYIREVSAVNGLNFAQVEGIGLVTGLRGTGSDPAPSWQRDHLIDELKSRGDVANPIALISSKDTSIVLVKGMIPPGARKGDPFDLEVVLPPNSETTSLVGGQLMAVRLKPMAMLGKRVREGKTLAVASGPVMADSVFESRSDLSNQVRAKVPGGGRAAEDRELALTLRSEELGPSLVRDVTQAINLRFTTHGPDGRVGVATAKTDRLVDLAVPEEYRGNIGRFVEVLQCIAWAESTDERVNRLELLDKQLGNPSMSKLAAMRLEAMGADAVPALRRGLAQADIEVRFHAAQALAFMGHVDGLSVLAQCAADESAFRWNALAALASLPDAKSAVALSRLMDCESAEARYGAFRALHSRSPHDPLVKGEQLAGGFSLHVIDSQTQPMLHISRSRRPEIVVFNDQQTVSDDLMVVEHGLTIRGAGNGSVSIVRFEANGGEKRLMSTTRVSDLVRGLSDAGCNYSTVVSILRQLKQEEKLESRLAVEALPRPGREYVRAVDPATMENEAETRQAGRLPDLFRSPASRNAAPPRDDQAQIGELNAANEARAARPTMIGRMKSFFTGSDQKTDR